MKRALFSLTNTTGMVPFAKQLVERDFEIVATTSTGRALREEGLTGIIDIEEVTGIPEGMDGRLKTLSPYVHGGILADRAKSTHLEYLAQHKMHEIDVVTVNLYDFAKAVAAGLSHEEVIEKIDIGGPTLLRAAAKNYRWCTPLCDPKEYDSYIRRYDQGGGKIDEEFGLAAAFEVFKLTALYDEQIATYLHGQLMKLRADKVAEQGI